MGTFKATVHNTLAFTLRPLTVSELVMCIPGSCGETISRALRQLRKEGKVRGERVPGDNKGIKRWTVTSVAFAEIDWAPGDQAQAVGRMQRKG